MNKSFQRGTVTGLLIALMTLFNEGAFSAQENLKEKRLGVGVALGERKIIHFPFQIFHSIRVEPEIEIYRSSRSQPFDGADYRYTFLRVRLGGWIFITEGGIFITEGDAKEPHGGSMSPPAWCSTGTTVPTDRPFLSRTLPSHYQGPAFSPRYSNG